MPLLTFDLAYKEGGGNAPTDVTYTPERFRLW